MKEDGPIQLDLRQVLASKMGNRARLVPGWLVRRLERTICQDQLNEKLRKYYPSTGAEFCQKQVEDFGIEARLVHPERLPDLAHRRIIIVSNHPLGGIDGTVLIAELSRIYGNGIRFIVNDLLMALGPLQDVFLPINKHGRQSRQAIEAINAALAGDEPVMIFPAGLVSRMGKGGEVKDLEWHKMFVTKAVQYQRDVLPIYFSGQNSRFFYKLAQWRKRLGIKFNIEMLYLPREMFATQRKSFDICVGELVPWQRLAEMGDALSAAQQIKEITYSLKQ